MKSVVAGLLIALLSFSSSVHGQETPKSKNADPPAKAPQATAANDTAQQRKMLEAIRTEDPAEIAAHRKLLAQGTEAQRVREFQNIYPSPSETWLTVLRRDAEDGRLLELYEQLVKDGKGTAKPEELLVAIGKAAMNDKPEATIGGEVITVSPALSLDAGYTKASLDKMTMAALGVADTQDNALKIKGIANGCLDGQNKKAPSPSSCYIAGLTFAAKDNSSRGAN